MSHNCQNINRLLKLQGRLNILAHITTGRIAYAHNDPLLKTDNGPGRILTTPRCHWTASNSEILKATSHVKRRMQWKQLSLWTRVWSVIIAFLILYPVGWYVLEKYIKGSTLLYETPITFMFFGTLIALCIVIWAIGLWIKLRK